MFASISERELVGTPDEIAKAVILTFPSGFCFKASSAILAFGSLEGIIHLNEEAKKYVAFRGCSRWILSSESRDRLLATHPTGLVEAVYSGLAPGHHVGLWPKAAEFSDGIGRQEPGRAISAKRLRAINNSQR